MTNDLDIRMIVEVRTADHGGQFFHVVARPVKWIYRDYESDRGWRADFGFDFDEPHLSNFEVRAQGDLKSEEPVYGWTFEYHEPYRVTLSDAERMVKVLRSVERALTRTNAEFGWPENVGQYIARVANALKIGQFGFYAPKNATTWANGDQIRWQNAAHLDSTIRERVAELRAR